jgi:hypothetical protein
MYKPRFIMDNAIVVLADTTIAFIGMFQPGGTFARKLDPGNPADPY